MRENVYSRVCYKKSGDLCSACVLISQRSLTPDRPANARLRLMSSSRRHCVELFYSITAVLFRCCRPRARARAIYMCVCVRVCVVGLVVGWCQSCCLRCCCCCCAGGMCVMEYICELNLYVTRRRHNGCEVYGVDFFMIIFIILLLIDYICIILSYKNVSRDFLICLIKQNV
uniref:Uncharacterized protein n=1 Tax=Papilio xuthus TaxID=66420 RepID=I4DIG8_PAPXU|nr:unknown unsecreted protein [Papilio xuthus]